MAIERATDAAWQRVLAAKETDLAAASFPIYLAMRDLAEHGRREPRLMLSMDSRAKCPPFFLRHGVFPLSVSTDRVALLRGDGWFDLEPVAGPRRVYEARLPFVLASSTIGKGENAHIMRLETSGFLRDFLGAEQILPVASGKRLTPSFAMRVHGTEVEVSRAQYEMDAQYESIEDIIPVEMKTRHYDSCAVRQIYYPFRSLGVDTGWGKPIRPLYITYEETSDDYIVRELGFRDRNIWESIYQVQAQAIRIRVVPPRKSVLDLDAPEAPNERIPQADSVAKIAEFAIAVARGMTSSSVIAEHFRFDPRQSSYYRDAVQSLGLVSLDGKDYSLTPDGRRYVDLPPQARADFLARRMSRLPVVRAVLRAVQAAGGAGLAQAAIPEILLGYARERKQPCNPTTARRRASTIRAYLDYIGSRTGALARVGGRYYLRENVPELPGAPPGK